MPIAQSFERRLEQFVEGFFARTFRSGLQPVELGRKLVREMDRGRTLAPNGIVVANHYSVALSSQDAERFSHFQDALITELKQGLEQEREREGWLTVGPLEVEFSVKDKLRLGRYVIESRIVESERKSNHRLVDAHGRDFSLVGDSLDIGRLPECAVAVDDANISRRHAQLVAHGDGYTIMDSGSTNGTYVNGFRIQSPTALRDGDRIKVGNSELTYRK